MQFDDDADLDTSEVQDVRGSRIPGGKATVGGGIVGLIALILGLFFGVGPDQLGLSSGDSGTTATASSAAQVEQSCRTGQDANTRDDCRTVAVVNSVQDFWRQEFARRGARYTDAKTVLFTDRIGTACGAATSRSGRSTARATGRSIWTWDSSTSCGRSSDRAVARSPRHTSSRTSTATMCRTRWER